MGRIGLREWREYLLDVCEAYREKNPRKVVPTEEEEEKNGHEFY